MKINIKLKTLIIVLISGQSIIAQNHNHTEDHHKHHKNEIGIANAPVYIIHEKSITYGLHIHYIRNFGESKYGIGLGYEQLFDDHNHKTFGIVGCYRPIEQVAVNLSPGIAFEGNDFSFIKFALHLEATYDFNINDFHIGPVFEFAYGVEDLHLSFGLHIGYGF